MTKCRICKKEVKKILYFGKFALVPRDTEGVRNVNPSLLGQSRIGSATLPYIQCFHEAERGFRG